MELSNDNSLPLYIQLTNQLREEIQNGTYKSDQRIPTEQELCRMHHISRITVRNALDTLAKERLLVRKQGRGTFVAHEKFKRDITRGSSFTQICLENGQTPGAKVIKSMIEDATPSDAEELQIPTNSKVIVLERIRYADGSPVALEISRFPERFSFLLAEDFNNTSLISILSEKYGITFGDGTKMIELIFATYEMAHYLDVANGYPLISISCVSTDMDGVPAHRSLQYVVGDRFKFFIK